MTSQPEPNDTDEVLRRIAQYVEARLPVLDVIRAELRARDRLIAELRAQLS